MVNFCPECGMELKENSNFCDNCGSQITPINYSPQIPRTQIPPTFYPKKNNKKSVIVVIAIIIVVMVVLLIIFGDFGAFGKDKRFVGTWTMTYEGIGITNTFTLYSNGKCEGIPQGFVNIADRWDIKNNKLVFYGVGYPDLIILTYSYAFSNNDNTLTLTLENNVNVMGGSTTVVYTKQL